MLLRSSNQIKYPQIHTMESKTPYTAGLSYILACEKQEESLLK